MRESGEAMNERVDDFFDKVVLPPQLGVLDTVAAPVRIVAGLVLIAVSIAKFTNHGEWVRWFEEWGVPNADRAVYLAGAAELIGGLCLVAGFMTRVVSVLLSLHFAVAVGTGGRFEQDLFHLGLGTALLAVSLFLIWAGAGPASVDLLIYRKRREWA